MNTEKVRYYFPIDIEDDFIIYMRARFSIEGEYEDPDLPFPLGVFRKIKKDDLKHIFSCNEGIVGDLNNNIPPSLKVKGTERSQNYKSFEIWEEEVG